MIREHQHPGENSSRPIPERKTRFRSANISAGKNQVLISDLLIVMIPASINNPPKI